jgi:glutamine cyclotransferase
VSILKKIYYKHPVHGKIIRFLMSNGDDFIDLNKPKEYGCSRTVRVYKNSPNMTKGYDILKESKTLFCKVFESTS